MKTIKVAHLSSVHKDGDIRIFHKECVSLAEAGFDVTFILANAEIRTDKGVKIDSVNSVPKSRIERIRKTVRLIYDRALALDADIYHFHDPELLRIGLKLVRKGKIVIYDAHEDTPRQILAKPYLNPFFRRMISFFYEKYENYAAKRMTAIVTVTPHIKRRYERLKCKVVEVSNFPLTSEICPPETIANASDRKKSVCYFGGISYGRGIKQMILAAGISNTELMIAGKWPDGIKENLKDLEGWRNVSDRGFCSRDELTAIKKENIAGLVTLLAEPNHINSYPIKMFEYMSSGLPVISSNFPLWQSIIEGHHCGVCVDPEDPKAIADAISYFANNPEKAREMGENGLKAIREQYNWDIEKKKLIALYHDLFGKV